MSKSSRASAAHRILVALDSSPHGLAALEAAARLAAELQVDLEGLFVEDVNLLRLAGLPFACEIDLTSASPRQLSQSAMERALRAKAEEARRAMARLADRLQVQWSFQIARGEVVRSTLAAAEEVDLLVMGRETHPPGPTAPLGRATRTATAPVLAAYDGATSAARALNTAARLARQTKTRLVVLLVAANDQDAQARRSELTALLDQQKLEATIAEQSICDAPSLVRATRQWKGSVLVLSRDCELLDETTIVALVDALDHPVVLTR